MWFGCGVALVRFFILGMNPHLVVHERAAELFKASLLLRIHRLVHIFLVSGDFV